MVKQQIGQLLEKISLYRPFFKSNYQGNVENLINEWFRLLEDYDYKDVDENLDEFFRLENTRTPSPYDLINGLRTIKQKSRDGKTFIYCDVCNMPLEVYPNEAKTKLDRTGADRHMARCRSIRYLKQLYRKYSTVELDENELSVWQRMNDREFDNMYYRIMEKAYEKMTNEQEKALTKKVLETKCDL